MTGYEPLLEIFAARRSGKGWDGCCPLAHRHRNGDRRPSLRLWVGGRGELVARCMGCGAGWGEIVRATGTLAREWWPDEGNQPHRNRRRVMAKVTAVYDYRDENGTLYGQKLRKESPEGKSFSWRRPLPPYLRDHYGIGPDEPAWVWGLEAGLYAPHEGDKRDWRFVRTLREAETNLPNPANSHSLSHTAPTLYRLPQLLTEPIEHPAVVVEGEGKANALHALGLCAVSGPSGAKVWVHDWASYFAGRRVVVIPDNNLPGLTHASVVAGSLLLHGAAAVKVIRPGELWPVADNEDVGDWLKRLPAQSRRKELADLFRRFPAFVAQVPAAPQTEAAA